MCLTIEKPRDSFLASCQQQYDLEVALMRKRIEKLNKKIEKNKLCQK